MTNVRFALALFAAAAVQVVAQDIVAVAPKNAKVEFENDSIRVVRLKMGPHEKLPPHDRPTRVVVALAANDVLITGPDGKPRKLHVPAENVGWGGPTHGRSVETLDTGFENVIVEIKNANEAAISVTHPPSPDDKKAFLDSDHHWLFENQYVRVFEVRVPPGTTGQFHQHAYRSVTIGLTEGVIASQVKDEGWTKAEPRAAGTASYADDVQKPRTHRVRNEGKTEYHAVLVQLLQ